MKPESKFVKHTACPHCTSSDGNSLYQGEEHMKAIYTSDNTEQGVFRTGNSAAVITGKGYRHPGELLCRVDNTGNGYVVYFPAPNCTTQDYFVCLDYAQARDLVLGLSMFKEELGFEDE